MDNSYDDLLTTAFRNPAVVMNNTTLLQHFDVLTISYTFDRTAAWIWTFVAILLSLASGITYSVIAKDFNTGLGVGTAVLAVLLAFQGLIVFLSR